MPWWPSNSVAEVTAGGVRPGRPWLLLGLTGSVAISIAGIAAGALPVHDPLDGIPAVLAWRHHQQPATLLAYAGLTSLIVAWTRLGRVVQDGHASRVSWS